jgi:hypothetical protein
VCVWPPAALTPAHSGAANRVRQVSWGRTSESLKPRCLSHARASLARTFGSPPARAWRGRWHHAERAVSGEHRVSTHNPRPPTLKKHSTAFRPRSRIPYTAEAGRRHWHVAPHVVLLSQQLASLANELTSTLTSLTVQQRAPLSTRCGGIVHRWASGAGDGARGPWPCPCHTLRDMQPLTTSLSTYKG